MSDEETETDVETSVEAEDVESEGVEERVEEQRERVEERAEEVLESVDDNVDRLLSEILDTRARVAVYVGLREKGGASVDEVSEVTGLYPDKVEGVLDDLKDDGIVEVESGEYKAISPTELVRRVPERVGEWLEDVLPRSGDDETTDIDVE
ncbi:MAG: helix-turn-helix domain-containing protein [Halobacteriales archaeon]